jgi:uncharacterized protein YqhQ
MGHLALAAVCLDRDDVRVDDLAVLAVLAEADAAPSLPRLGGMARPDGVAIVSERFWSFKRVDDTAVSVRPMPVARSPFARLPFVRGLVRLAAAIVPLLGRGAAAPSRERVVLVCALLAPVPLLVFPAAYRTPLLATVTAALICWMFRGRTLRLHGAEHRAIAAAEARTLVSTWHGSTRPSRFSPRCGTNFAALVVGVSILLERVWVVPTAALTPILLPLLSLMIAVEIWLVAQRSAHGLGRLLLLPGLLLQRLTTREPTIEDTRVALRAVAAVLAAAR